MQIVSFSRHSIVSKHSLLSLLVLLVIVTLQLLSSKETVSTLRLPENCPPQTVDNLKLLQQSSLCSSRPYNMNVPLIKKLSNTIMSLLL